MCSTDIIISPYFVFPEYRNHGLGKRILTKVSNDSREKQQTVYAVVMNDNTASIKVLKSCGFEIAGYAKNATGVINYQSNQQICFF